MYLKNDEYYCEKCHTIIVDKQDSSTHYCTELIPITFSMYQIESCFMKHILGEDNSWKCKHNLDILKNSLLNK